MNLAAAQQAASSIDLAIRAGGVQAALSNLDLLNAIAEAGREAKAAADAEAAARASEAAEEVN